MKNNIKFKTIRDLVECFEYYATDAIAFCIKIKGQTIKISYKDLLNNVCLLGAVLIKMGIKKGDKIGICSGNRLEWPIVYLAVTSIGAIIVPVDIYVGTDDFLSVIKNSDMKFIFLSGGYFESLMKIKGRCKKLEKVICFDQELINQDELEKNLKIIANLPGEIGDSGVLFEESKLLSYELMIKAGLQISEDAISLFKNQKVESYDIASMICMHDDIIVQLEHKALMSNAQAAMKQLDGYADPGDICVAALPFNHTYPTIFQMIMPLICQARVDILDSSSVAEMIMTIKETKAKIFSTVPIYLKQILNKIIRDNIKLDTIKYLLVGGASIHKHIIDEFENLNIKVIQGYGLSEYAPAVCLNRPNFNRPGSIGFPLPDVEIRIEQGDENGNGELLVRGPSIMAGYYKKPKETSEVIDSDGWLHTGDIARIDSEGFVYITGRKKNVIVNIGGKNVYPQEIEKILLKSALISQVCVYPVLDKVLGEHPDAIVMPNLVKIKEQFKNLTNIDSEKEITKIILNAVKELTKNIARYKVPRKIEISYDKEKIESLKGNKIMFEDIYQSENKVTTKKRKPVSVIEETEILKYLKNDILSIIATILEISKSNLDIDENINNYGLSSIQIINFSNDVNNKYNITITPAIFFEIEFLSISSISQFLYNEYKRNFDSYYSQTEKTINEFTQLEKVEKKENEQVSGVYKNVNLINNNFKEQNDREDIAIIGMNGIMPQSDNLEALWANFINEKDLICEIPKERWDYEEMFGEDCLNRWGGFINNVDKFDPIFFGISPLEAETMDPQQRIFLEVAWGTIEDAGYKTTDLSGTNTGIFVGVATSDYIDIVKRSKSAIESHVGTGFAHSVIANRISYLLNLNGPSEAIDTACSSSIVAIHRAVRSIQNGDCDIAIAGGINIILDPSISQIFTNSGVIASDGRCKTFDKKADGYVRGEGAGAIMLKPLRAAEADEDHIYGIIKGVSVNHGGRAKSLMAPNVNSQAQLIINAYEEACVNPYSVSYIETHGTGTKLGDPVEINGLKKAFKFLNEKHQKNGFENKHYCALGAAKTYFGHLEAAAGIAGVIKVLLSMKYKLLTKNLHFNELNPYIDLNESPFYILDETKPWECIKDMHGNFLPRIAGVSSFGFGGSNAHVVLEEYIDERGLGQKIDGNNSYIIVLSAKNEERLYEYAKLLFDFLNNISLNDSSKVDLQNIAYTLQVGRNEMEDRLAVVVKNIEELTEKLSLYLKGCVNIEGLYKGNLIENVKSKTLNHDEGFIELIEKWINSDKLSNIAALWVDGMAINWKLLYKNKLPKRLSLPVYPFAKNKCWVTFNSKSLNANSILEHHPLIDKILYKFPSQGIIFKKSLTTSQIILRDHKVFDCKVFPAVGYLEMAYACISNILDDNGIIINHVSWIHPLIVTHSEDVRLIIRETGNQIYWQVKTDNQESAIIHAEGKYRLCEKQSERKSEFISINDIKAESCYEADKMEVYKKFNSLGITYGPYFQGVNQIWSNDREAIGYISLPDEYKDQLNDYTLNPALMDSALQVISSLFNNHTDQSIQNPMVPIGIEEVEILHPLKTNMYSYVTSAGNLKFNVALIDERGLICVKLHEVSIKELDVSSQVVFKQKINQSIYYNLNWVESPLEINSEVRIKGLNKIKNRIVIISQTDSGNLVEALVNAYGQDDVITILLSNVTKQHSNGYYEINIDDPAELDNCINLISDKGIDAIYFLGGFNNEEVDITDLKTLEKCQKYGIISLFRLIKSLIKYNLTKQKMTLKIITNDVYPINTDSEPGPNYASLHGFTKSLLREYPVLDISCIDIGMKKDKVWNDSGLLSIAEQIIAEPGNKTGFITAFRNGKRFIQKLDPTILSVVNETPFKQQGVYLILGGAGGIGFELGKYLANEVKAKLIIIGRSELGGKIQDKLSELRQFGAEVEYFQADVTNLESMALAVKKAKKRFGSINGVIHSAIELRDRSLEFMTEEDLLCSLGPKVRGSLILHRVMNAEKLDFLMFFSSVLSIFGNAGQSNYSAGSTFQDVFAEYLNSKEKYPVISINWGFWGTVGRVATDSYNARMLAVGIQSISPDEGMEAIKRILGNNVNRLVVHKTNDKIDFSYKKELNESAKKYDEIDNNNYKQTIIKVENLSSEQELYDLTVDYVKGVFSQVLKVKKSVIEKNITFEKYGVDSLTGMKIIRLFEETFGDLPVTLLYENMTIDLLSKYFMENHKEQIKDKFNSNDAGDIVTDSDIIDKNTIFRSTIADKKRELISRDDLNEKNRIENGEKENVLNQDNNDIAIIGLSGQYPKSRNIGDFWDNLKNGINCIDLIPEERWNWKEYEKLGINRWGGFLKDIDKFDAMFFNISPKEAEGMDPQERLFLEAAWSVLEDSGYTRKDLSQLERNVGVFVGVMNCTYEYLGAEARLNGVNTNAHISNWSIANRVSYFFNFNGPSIALDTACSSSLTALHLACESIKRGECSLALTGGVNLILHPKHYLELTAMNMLSREDKCKTFGDGADGFVAGEGVGAVLLKNADKARRDGDNIYGIIKGTFINTGGKTSGYTVPNPNSQADVIKQALKNSNIDPRSISYIEAHGTGTALGDPIEIIGLNKAFNEYTLDKQFCAVGSVKSNIGHLESTAGIAGLTKVLLQMKHKKLVPSLHSQTLNPKIDFVNSPFYVQRELGDWEPVKIKQEGCEHSYPRRAGISSFGAGGANAHIVLEEFNEKEEGRKSVVFMFSGVGEHYVNMGRELYETNKTFQKYVDQGCTFIKNNMNIDLLSYLYPDNIDSDSSTKNDCSTNQDNRKIFDRNIKYEENNPKEINHPVISHPTTFIVEFALAKSLLDCGIYPNVMIGESLGEYVAACLSGVITYEEALLMIYERSRLIQNSPKGAMTVVLMPEADVMALLNDNLSLAVVNTGFICVVSGPLEAIAMFENKLTEMGIVFNRLPIYQAFHSRLLESISEEFIKVLEKIEFKEPKIPYISNLTGTWINRQEVMTKEYWIAHTCRTVRLYDGIRELLVIPDSIFVEVGPGKTLSNFVFQIEENKKILENKIFQTLPGENERISGKTAFNNNINEIVSMLNNSDDPQIFVFSAKNKDRLKANILNFINFIRNNFHTGSEAVLHDSAYDPISMNSINCQDNMSFRNIAYTLQVGRESMSERLAMVVSNFSELIDKLTDFSNAKIDIENVFIGEVSESDENMNMVMDGNEGRQFVQSLIDNKNLIKLARLWVAGVEINWRLLHKSQTVRRVSLPTYQFARERHWIADIPGIKTTLSALQETKDIEERQINQITPEYKDCKNLKDIAVYFIKEAISSVTNLDIQKIDSMVNLDSYGIDSIMIGQLNEKFEKQFGQLPSTLLFEYKNINSLAEYFEINHSERLKEMALNVVNSSNKNQQQLQIANKHDISISNPGSQDIKVVYDHDQTYEDIAIIGISGIYPMARDIGEFWLNLKSGKDCITEIPKERWDYKRYFSAEKNKPAKMYSKWGGFIEDVDKFDPLFFGISPLVARSMDPQERLFLQTAWACLEDAGYTRKMLENPQSGDNRGNVGVFVGVTFNEYPLHGIEQWAQGNIQPLSSQIFSVANRVSYTFNLGGPSLSVDTACSSSLYAIHLACESIRNKECDSAIAGGVNLSLHPNKYILSSSLMFASSDGHCRSFGEGGDGYVAGEGVGACLLKPVKAALRDGDHIYALIKGTAVNHNGKTNGYTVPNPVAQSEVIRTAIEKSKIHPRTISYIEAHGTGTALGDPIEIAGLSEAFGIYTTDRQFCRIGSVKSNIGHLESAAGIAQLTKVVLQMKHKTLVPSLLHSDKLNTKINFENTPFIVQQEVEHWQPRTQKGQSEGYYPRRAGVSSFGAGGVNVHIVMEEYENKNEERISNADKNQNSQDVIIALSAKERESLRQNVKKLKDFLVQEENKDTLLLNVGYTLQTGREPMPFRIAFVANSIDNLIDKLSIYLNSQKNNTGKTCIESEIFEGFLDGADSLKNSIGNKEEDQVYLDKIIQEKNILKLAKLWTEGVFINWEKLYTEIKPQRISLPTYSFLKKRYWLNILDTQFNDGILTEEKKEITHERFDLSDNIHICDDKGKSMQDCGTDIFLNELAKKSEDEQNEMIILYFQKILAEILGFQTGQLPEIDHGFFDMGMESIQVSQLLESISKKFNLKLNPTVIFDYPTIKSFTEYIMEKIKFDNLNQSKNNEVQSDKYEMNGIQVQNDNIYLKSTWQELIVNENIGNSSLGNLLLFDTDRKLYYTLREECEKVGKKLVLILQGTQFCEVEENVYEINPICLNDYAMLFEKLKKKGFIMDGIIHLWSRENFNTELKILEVQLHNSIYSIFMLTKSIINLNIQNDIKILYIFYGNREKPQPHYAALSGFAQSVKLENKKLNTKIIQIDNNAYLNVTDQNEQVLKIIKTEIMSNDETVNEIRYEGKTRSIKKLEILNIDSMKINEETDKELISLKKNGVYIITGGVGGVGLIFAKYFAETLGAKLVLTGRSDLTDEKKLKIDGLRSLGSEVVYIKSDVSVENDVKTLIDETKKKFKEINGIIHCAGIVQDAYLRNKSVENLNSILSSKVYGTINIDEVTKEENLDFLMMFSSVVSIMGNIGQSDYAYGNSFIDNFSDMRKMLVKKGQRKGKTISINWPIWREGGMKVDNFYQEYMKNTFGLVPLEKEDGITAMKISLVMPGNQLIVFKGNVPKINAFLKEFVSIKSSSKTIIKNMNFITEQVDVEEGSGSFNDDDGLEGLNQSEIAKLLETKIVTSFK